MTAVVILRMTVFADAGAYRNNALMNANGFALGLAFVLFGLFNIIFVGGFFKTICKIGKPFIEYIIVTFIVIGIGESLHHFPGLSWLNAFGTEKLGAQAGLVLTGIVIYSVLTFFSYRRSCCRLEKIDL